MNWIASAETLKEYQSEVNLMKEGEIWKSETKAKFHVWMEKLGFLCIKFALSEFLITLEIIRDPPRSFGIIHLVRTQNISKN